MHPDPPHPGPGEQRGQGDGGVVAPLRRAGGAVLPAQQAAQERLPRDADELWEPQRGQLVEDARYLGNGRRPRSQRARLLAERAVADRKLERDLPDS